MMLDTTRGTLPLPRNEPWLPDAALNSNTGNIGWYDPLILTPIGWPFGVLFQDPSLAPT
jgi:hypothetical protein